ncbi:endonuclease/exonuclease/phosphatase family protein [Actinocatenispora rupis]|uniref:Endonuclease/exonuclease/phosphatase domain-containing protein n=1 Tax=Actinocatenispora rupis TaxID=519421 RepID=A0A8J3J416_9ACTN|nr:endonuclease/exonuclease/phosphatase family protein [Actinocatenispora rupis]GID14280.1 hypothetical protein Aru02nite_51690 [Actinocatenispora rupis]
MTDGAGRTPLTFTAMTYNLWGRWRVADRMPALRGMLRLRQPDLLATQELHPVSRDTVDAALPGHDRVHDDFPGWATRSNLWWRRDLFSTNGHGAEDVGIRSEHARLFWVRLRRPGAPELVFATAHLTWPGHPDEIADDRSPRVAQSRAIVAALADLAGPDDAVLFCSDVNDYARPLWTFQDAGYAEPFGWLGTVSPVTHPVYPLALAQPPRQPGVQITQKAIDWQFLRGPLRPRSAEVVEYFADGVAPSDHKPVLCTYGFPAEREDER